MEYPPWANFVGAMIVISSLVWIPSILIGRLIFLETARQEARDFLHEKVDQFERRYVQFKDFVRSVPGRMRRASFTLRRNQQSASWEQFSNGTEYTSANE